MTDRCKHCATPYTESSGVDGFCCPGCQQVYLLIQQEDLDLGYLAFEKRAVSLFLSKIYLLESKRGMGYGRTAMAFVENSARNMECAEIALTVNKYNDQSINTYTRMGFSKKGGEITDIGGGFVMDDYRMVKPL